jgi:peptidyl-dipeptidase Dcp
MLHGGWRAIALVLTVSLSAPALGAAAAENPFFSPSTLPYGAPPFDRIQDGDYLPAFTAGIAEKSKEIEAIADNPAPPTFENTFVAWEKSGRLLDRVQSAFAAASEANTNPTLQHVEEVVSPQLAALDDAIFLNAKLFARVTAIYQHLDTLGLDAESRRLVETRYRAFLHNGANLNDADKAKLRQIDERLSVLRTQFQRKLLAGTRAGALVVSGDAAQLAGLDANAVAAASAAAAAHDLAGKWMIPLQNTTQQPALGALTDRAVRQQLFENSWTRTEKGDANDTRDTIVELAQLRAQKAELLGYPNYAAYALTDEMAKTPEAVQRFLDGLIPPTRAKAESEAADIQAAIDADGAHFALEPWDWTLYAEQVRKAKYDLDDKAIRPYFELNNVLENGLFYAANRLYGITFKERHDVPVYHPDVRVFEVFDKDGSPLALFYFDFFKRDNKSGGAWMNTFVRQSTLLGTKPVVYNVENIPKPPAGQPVLLSLDSVTGMFHEFGHGLNGIFANERYPSLSGTGTSRDFVEYPSQFNEHWALYPEVLKHYAVDYRTGAPMPQALIEKIESSRGFDQGYALGELLAADKLDLAWHTISASAPKPDVDAFETQALNSSYFAHIWSSGYAAGYYAYAWSEMLDDDTFAWFVAHGGLTRENGQRFRDMILSRGNSEDPAEMFRAFYGKDPEVGPMLYYRGLSATP